MAIISFDQARMEPHPSSPRPLPTGLPTGWGTHQGHSDCISIPKHALEAAKSRRAGGAQMRERSHEWVWSGWASWRRRSGGYPGRVKLGEGLVIALEK